MGSNTGAIGNTVFKCDNGSANISMLNFCKNNVAPNFLGWQLHYKLQNPEPLTDINCHVSGDIPKLDEGDNYVYVDSGIVLGEVAKPVLATNMWINDNDTTSKNSILRNKTEVINALYKNSIYDLMKWSVSTPTAYGKQALYTSPTNFDSAAVYTVDYKILATQAPSIGSINASYTQSVISAINSLEEKVNTRQKADSSLDTLVDLSVYEEVTLKFWPVTKYITTSGVYILVCIPITPKKTKPKLTFSNTHIDSISLGGDITSKFIFDMALICGNMVRVSFYTNDTNIVTNAKNYGIQLSTLKMIASCN